MWEEVEEVKLGRHDVGEVMQAVMRLLRRKERSGFSVVAGDLPSSPASCWRRCQRGPYTQSNISFAKAEVNSQGRRETYLLLLLCLGERVSTSHPSSQSFKETQSQLTFFDSENKSLTLPGSTASQKETSGRFSFGGRLSTLAAYAARLVAKRPMVE